MSGLAGPRFPVLLVDVGNSRIKWRLMNGGSNLEGVCEHRALADRGPLQWHSMLKPDSVLVSAVSGKDKNLALKSLCRRLWGLDPEFVRTTGAACGVRNGYKDPEQLGVDRWLALLAARMLSVSCTVVIDCGTAITADLLDRDGCFRGGMILPGLRMQEAAFRDYVPHLAAAASGDTEFPADNTADAILLGIRTSIVAAMDQFVENAASLTEVQPLVRLTGGDGPWLSLHWPRLLELHDNLVLDGLQVLLEHNA